MTYASCQTVETTAAATLKAAKEYTDSKQIPNATTIARGIIQLSTSAESKTGTDPEKAVTPATLKATYARWVSKRFPDLTDMALTELGTRTIFTTTNAVQLVADTYFALGTPQNGELISVTGGFAMEFTFAGSTAPMLGVTVAYDIDNASDDGGNDDGREGSFEFSAIAVNIGGNGYRITTPIHANLAYENGFVKARVDVTPIGFSWTSTTNRTGKIFFIGAAQQPRVI